MKAKINSFPSDNTQEVLSDFKTEMHLAAKSALDFPIKSQLDNPMVIPIDKFNVLLDKQPSIVANQVVKSKLTRLQVYGFERGDTEERLTLAGNIKKFLNKFFPSIDHLSENVFYEMIESWSIPFSAALKQKEKFLLVSDLKMSVNLRLLIACLRFESDGFGAWYGIYSTPDIHKLQAQLNTANNLSGAASIIPIEIYSDAMEIAKIVDLLHTITNFLVGGRDYTRFESDDLEADRLILEGILAGFLEKYSCLSTQDYQKFAAALLNAYTMSPSLMIERMGPDTICFPYSIPKDFELPENEKIEWEEEEDQEVQVSI